MSRRAIICCFLFVSIIMLLVSCNPEPAVERERINYTRYESGEIHTEEVYDSNNVLLRVVYYEKDGRIQKLNEYSLSKLVRSTEFDSAGNKNMVTEYEYDQKGKILKETRSDAEGHIIGWTERSYLQNGKTDKTVEYDSNGKIKGTTQYSYLENGNTSSVTRLDSNGIITSVTNYVYDEKTGARLSQMTVEYTDGVPSGKVTEKEIDPDGNTKKQTDYDANGKKTREQEFSDGKLAKRTDYNSDEKVKTELEYDEEEKVDIRTDYSYDPEGNYTGKTVKVLNGKENASEVSYYDASGKKTREQQYSDNGKLKKRTDFNSDEKAKTELEYDEEEKVDTRTEFSYDSEGNYTGKTVKVLSGKENASEIVYYDASGKKTREQQYSDNGKLKERTDFNSDEKAKTELEYDEEEKVDIRTDYSYDSEGNYSGKTVKVLKGKEIASKITYYDANGKKTRDQQYDSDGNLEKRVDYYSDGKEKSTQVYDTTTENLIGKLISRTDYDSEGRVSSLKEYEYDPATGIIATQTDYGYVDGRKTGNYTVWESWREIDSQYYAGKSTSRNALNVVTDVSDFDYYEDGKKQKQTSWLYENGKRTGEYTISFFDGKGNTSSLTYYDAADKKTRAQQYEDGKLKKRTDFNSDEKAQTVLGYSNEGYVEYRTEYTYDQDGKLSKTTIKHLNADGSVLDISYVNHDGHDDEIEYDGDGSVIGEREYIYEDGIVKGFISKDSSGNITGKTEYEYDTDGKTLTIQRDYKYNGNEYVLSTVWSEYVSGNATNSEEYDSNGAITGSSTFEYSADGKKLKQTTKLYENGRETGSRTEKEFDGSGNTSVLTYFDAVNRITRKLTYGYDENGKKTSQTEYEYKDGKETGKKTIKSGYNGTEKASKREVYSNEVLTSEYELDADENTIARTDYKYKNNVESGKTVWEGYDDKGNPSISTDFDAANLRTKKTEYVYGENGKKTSQTEYEHKGGNPTGNYTVKVFDEGGNTVALTYFNSEKKITRELKYEYDGIGKKKSQAEYEYKEGNPTGNCTVKEFDESGNTIALTYFNSENKITRELTYEYDEKGKKESQTEYEYKEGERTGKKTEKSGYNDEGKASKRKVFIDEVLTNEYDLDGNENTIKRIDYKYKESSSSGRTEWVDYDGNGNPGKSIDYNASDKKTSEKVYEYYDDGKRKTITETTFDESGNVTKTVVKEYCSDGTTLKKRTDYDANGNVTREQSYEQP